jgi:hypothetical protein
VVGDYFKVNSNILAFTDSATNLITWLRGKTFLLALIREEQLKTSGVTSAVIHAVISRWTTHLRAYERILLLRNVLRSVIITDANRPTSQIVIGDRASKTKAKKMIELIDNSVFWQSLARYRAVILQLYELTVDKNFAELFDISGHLELQLTSPRLHSAVLILYFSPSATLSLLIKE